MTPANYRIQWLPTFLVHIEIDNLLQKTLTPENLHFIREYGLPVQIYYFSFDNAGKNFAPLSSYVSAGIEFSNVHPDDFVVVGTAGFDDIYKDFVCLKKNEISVHIVRIYHDEVIFMNSDIKSMSLSLLAFKSIVMDVFVAANNSNELISRNQRESISEKLISSIREIDKVATDEGSYWDRLSGIIAYGIF